LARSAMVRDPRDVTRQVTETDLTLISTLGSSLARSAMVCDPCDVTRQVAGAFNPNHNVSRGHQKPGHKH
jgi:hypothetical protein